MNEKYEYNQVVKEYVRNKTLKYAIEQLTKNRIKTVCVENDYVRDMYDWYCKQDYEPKSQEITSGIRKDYIDSWESFHTSMVGSKEAKDLTVCYLSGPNPMNDFKVLVNNGIHPNNIWAFEVDKGTYKHALTNIDSSEYPMLKLHKGSIEQFFIHIPKKFDIVYLDFCGAIPSSQYTTRVISSLFKNQRLNSPGALITNIALPDISKKNEMLKYSNIVAEYLFHKKYLECSKNGIIENEISDFKSFRELVSRNFENYYSQFITRHIFDIACIITPWTRFANSVFWSKFFNKSPKEISNLNMNDYSLPIVKSCCSSFIEECDYLRLKNSFIDQLGGLPNPTFKIQDVLKSVGTLKLNSKFYNPSFSVTLEDYSFENEMYQFCDKPNKNIAFDLITNQLAYPMHYVTDMTKRFSYIAKDTEMFTDVLFFDECRYIYEWLPTVDLLIGSFNDVSQQLIYRFALDGLVKNRMWYNSEFFYGSSAINIHEHERFNGIELSSRIKVDKFQINGG